jgi:site-specific recombinase XerD
MNPTDFAYYLSNFLTTYLAGQRNLSRNTIQSYRDTFSLLLRYFSDSKNMAPEKISVNIVCKESVEEFLLWLEKERECGISSRNQRLAAIHAFFRYLQSEKPEHMHHCQRILSIPFKKAPKKPPVYLSDDEIGKLLSMPDMKKEHGRRDATMLSLLYDSGARVQELADLTPRDLRLEQPFYITLTGKGRKTRHVPIMRQTASLLISYIREQKINSADKLSHPLFFNSRKEKLTRQGIAYILNKYAESIKVNNSVTPHVLRHSKAMALTQADVNPIYIRDILGHADLKTTSVYSKSNIEMKRKALEKVEEKSIPDVPDWTVDNGLMDFLKNLGKQK